MVSHVSNPRRCLIVLMVVSLVLAPAAALAQGQNAGEPPPIAPVSISGSLARAAERWPAEWAVSDVEEVSQAEEQRSWIARHPALVGALIGAGAGAGLGYGLGQECTGQEVEPCSSKGEAAVVGAGIFGGIGAFVGWIVGRTTK